MEIGIQPMQEPQANALSRQPTVSPSLVRRLPVAIAVTVAAAAGVIALLVVLKGRHDLWPVFGYATGVAVLSAAASMVIILQSAGKPAEFVVTMVMLLSVVRIALSLGGLLVCVLVLETPAAVTAMMIGGYYVATLAVESSLVRGALNGPAQGTSEIQGKQG